MNETKAILTCSPKPRQFSLRNITTGEIESFSNIRQTSKLLGYHPTMLSYLLTQKISRIGDYILPDKDVIIYKLLQQESEREIFTFEHKKPCFKSNPVRLDKNSIKSIKNAAPSFYRGLKYLSEKKYEAVKINRIPEPSRVKSQVPKAKSFKIKNILTGEITCHKSVNKFALENGLEPSSLFYVLDKTRKSAGNYCHPNTKVEFLDIYNLATKKWEKNCNLQLKDCECLKSGLKKIEVQWAI